MLISITHDTHYRFDKPVFYALQRIRLRPKNTQGQVVREWSTDIVGGDIECSFDDHHANHSDLLTVKQGVEELIIRCHGVVETDGGHHGVLGRHSGYIPLWMFKRATTLTKNGPLVNALVRQAKELPHDNAIALLHELSALIQGHLPYDIGHTNATTTAEQALSVGKGVCQDHAHIFISAARALGFPARYVGGYLHMADRVEQEAGHAWAEAWVEDVGWIGFDISNGISPDEHYVRVATGFDYRDAAPVTAISYGARDRDMDVRLKIEQRAEQ